MSSLSLSSSQLGWRWKTVLLRVLPKLLLLAAFIQLSNDSVVRNHRLLVERGEDIGVVFFLAIWGATLAAVMVAAFLPSLRWRLTWALAICLSTVCGKAFQNVMGNDITLADLALLWQARDHFTDALVFFRDDLLSPVLAAGLGFLAIVLPSAVEWRRLRALFEKLHWFPLVPAFLLLALTYGHKSYLQGLPQQFAPLVIAGVFAGNQLSGFEIAARAGQDVGLPLGAPARVRHIVLLLDESVRGDFIDLNRNRGTTPYLLTQTARLANFGIAVSGANCSAHSNAILRFGARREGLPDSLFNGPMIWQFARQAGFRTVFVDGQLTGGALQNFMHAGELDWIDDFIQFDGVDKTQRDLAVADRLRDLLAKQDPSFIYVNKMGVHFPYSRAYPPEEAIFAPHMQPNEAAGKSRERMENSYKNGVRWSVDAFFRRLLRGLDLRETLIIYSSDHGQHLMEDQSIGTHCRTQSPHVSEGIVPLLVLTEQSELRSEFAAAASMNWNRGSHFNLLPTLLEALGYQAGAVRDRYGAGLTDRIDAERAFAAGGMLPATGRRPNWIVVSPDDLERHRGQAAATF